MTPERIPTGVAGLDAMLHGGFMRGASVLLHGAPGTGKTTLALHYLKEGGARDEPGLLISFEEFPQSLYRDAESLGWDLRQWEAEGWMHVLFTSPGVLMRDLETATGPLSSLLQKHPIRRVVVDSMTHFTRISREPHQMRHIYNTVINGLKREGTTPLLLGEEGADKDIYIQSRLAFVVDCILMMRYLEIESAIERAILVLKMRSSPHDKAIHRYTIGKGGIQVGDVLKGRSGLLSGLASHSIVSSVR